MLPRWSHRRVASATVALSLLASATLAGGESVRARRNIRESSALVSLRRLHGGETVPAGKPAHDTTADPAGVAPAVDVLGLVKVRPMALPALISVLMEAHASPALFQERVTTLACWDDPAQSAGALAAGNVLFALVLVAKWSPVRCVRTVEPGPSRPPGAQYRHARGRTVGQTGA